MSEYPKSCAMEEAIECVKAGGKARLRGTGENTWTIISTYSGDACFLYATGGRCYSHDFIQGWIYEITEPAPSASKKTHTTAEAVAWVLRSGEEMTGKRRYEDNGSEYGIALRLVRDSDGDVRCYGNSSQASLSFIPGDAIWTKKQTKPEPISRDVTLVGDGDVRGLVEAHVEEIKSHWTGKVRVRWTVEAVD
jgi:hypothetical protein